MMIQYRNATIEDMGEVAKTHILTQPEYFTSTLGEDLLKKFYTEFLKEDDLFIVAVDDETDKIVGFCMGHYFGSPAEKRWERKYRWQIVGRLLVKCLQLNRLALSRSFGRVKSIFIRKKPGENAEKYFSHLLSLGVLSDYRRKHIASALIDTFEKKCLSSTPPPIQKLLCKITVRFALSAHISGIRRVANCMNARDTGCLQNPKQSGSMRRICETPESVPRSGRKEVSKRRGRYEIRFKHYITASGKIVAVADFL